MTNFKKNLMTAIVSAMMFSMAGAASAQDQDCHMLSIGIDKYEPFQGNLSGPVKDAKDTQALFQGQKGKLFANVYGTILLDGQATRAAAVAKMNEWSGKPKEGDLAVLSLAGHGNRTGDGWFFCCVDNQPLKDGEILKSVVELAARGVKVMVIIDSCHSGAFRKSAAGQLEGNGAKGDGGLILVMGCSPQEVSSEANGNGIMTRALLEGLSGAADRNNDGNVTLAEIRFYTHKRTEELTKLRQYGYKLPGLAREEQHAEVVHSLTITDGTVIAKATKKDGATKIETPETKIETPEQNPAESTQKPSEKANGPAGSTQKPRESSAAVRPAEGSIAGEWKTTVKTRNAQGQVVDLTYTIRLDGQGRYSVKLSDSNKVHNGNYSLKAGKLVLVSENDRDEVSVTWINANSFKATFEGRTLTLERVN